MPLFKSKFQNTINKYGYERVLGKGQIVDSKKSNDPLIREKAIKLEQARIERRRELQLSEWVKKINKALSSIRKTVTIVDLKEELFYMLFSTEIKKTLLQKKLFEIQLRKKFDRDFYSKLYESISYYVESKRNINDYFVAEKIMNNVAIKMSTSKVELLRATRLSFKKGW